MSRDGVGLVGHYQIYHCLEAILQHSPLDYKGRITIVRADFEYV